MKKAIKEKSADRYQRIYKCIRERICLLHYPPGSRLNETELAAEFDVSRTPLRRVLQQLNHEGLLETKNGVGTIVTDINMKTFKDIYALRILLAEAMGSLSPNQASSRHIEIISDLIERAEAIQTKRDVEEYARIANDLEELLIDLIGSDPVKEITDILYYRVSRIWFTFLPNLDWESVIGSQLIEMSKMRDALKQGDIQAVGEIRKFHLGGILKKISHYISK